MMECKCKDFADLELLRDEISKRIDESDEILNSLNLIGKSENRTQLYECNSCGQYWQRSLAWNWGGKEYLFKVPKIEFDLWNKEQFVSPADMLIYSALMSDYFEKNQFTESDNICIKEDCNNKALKSEKICKKHFVKSLQNVGILPKDPDGRMFEPYSYLQELEKQKKQRAIRQSVSAPKKKSFLSKLFGK